MTRTLTIPNQLTFFRMVLVPAVIVAVYIDSGVLAHRIAAGLFLLASITDFLDGYLARTYSQLSTLGKVFDPIADKILVVLIVVILVDQDRAPLLPGLAIIARELLVSGLREHLAEIRVSMPVSKLSKIKTAAQMTSLSMLLLGNIGTGWSWVNATGQGLFWIAALLTLITGYAYLRKGIDYLR